jgi:hypothetical protein
MGLQGTRSLGRHEHVRRRCWVTVSPQPLSSARDAANQRRAPRERYAAVKRRVGATATDIDEYGRGKNATIQQILAVAGMSSAELALIDANQVPSHEELPR